MSEFAGKTALVTGASRGIGAAIAEALASAGADVAIAARTIESSGSAIPGSLEETSARIVARGRRAVIVPADLSVEGDVVAMVRQANDHLGRLDILVNNAAVASPGGLQLDLRHFDLLMHINTRAPMVAIREFADLPGEPARRQVLNISSAAASYLVPGLTGYGMSKLALEHFTRSAAVELAPRQIEVNCFRVDVRVASEGVVYRTGGDHAGERPETAAEGALWILRQPTGFTGHLISMAALGAREGIMCSGIRPVDATECPVFFPGLEISL